MSVDGAQYRVDQALKNSGWNKTNGWSAGLDSISKDHFSASAAFVCGRARTAVGLLGSERLWRRTLVLMAIPISLILVA